MATDPKRAILARARKLASEIERYAAFGYVTAVEDYEKDDRSLWRRIDGLYDSAQKAGLLEDVELQQYREQLRVAMREARARASVSRQELLQAQAGLLGKRQAPPGMQGYLDEWKLDEARRKARRS